MLGEIFFNLSSHASERIFSFFLSAIQCRDISRIKLLSSKARIVFDESRRHRAIRALSRLADLAIPTALLTRVLDASLLVVRTPTRSRRTPATRLCCVRRPCRFLNSQRCFDRSDLSVSFRSSAPLF